MNSNEEYLDNLLKSMSDSDNKTEKESNSVMTVDDIEAMFAAAQKAADEEVNSPNHTVESTKDLSNDEIVKLLEESEQTGMADPLYEEDKAVEDDLDALLMNLEQNEDLNEINELLKMADNNELVADNSNEETDSSAFMDEDIKSIEQEEESDSIQKAKKEKKKKRSKKTKVKDQNEGFEEAGEDHKKKGLLGNILSLLTAEDDGNSNATSENQTIMDELAAEDREEENKKKKIKKGKVFGKSIPQKDGEEIKDENKGKQKTVKPKKNPKPKKEKAPKKLKEESYETPSKKISRKSIFVVLLFSVSVFIALMFGIYLGSTMIQKNSAIKAFANRDYITCYEQLYGMKLSDNESRLLHHAEVVLRMQRRIDMYEKYINDDKELEALDSLMRALTGYDELYSKAVSYGAASEIAVIYDEILGILKEQYDLSQEDARAIANCTSNVEYTRYLTALVNGQSVSSDVNSDGIILPIQDMEDVLSAEEELEQPNFAD